MDFSFKNAIRPGSKYPATKAMFQKKDQQIEKWTKIIFFVVMRIGVQCTMLPTCIGSFILYLTTDLGQNAFVLPIPMWWVVKSKSIIHKFHNVAIELPAMSLFFCLFQVSFWHNTSIWLFDWLFDSVHSCYVCIFYRGLFSINRNWFASVAHFSDQRHETHFTWIQ